MGALRPVGAVALLLLLAACAQPGTTPPGAEPSPSTSVPADGDTPVLQVTHVGGFVTPEALATRLPIVAVYGDGRVITEGPVIAIYPSPALPNVQVTRLHPTEVQELVQRALDAGVDETSDLGTPPIADAPTTRFTVVTGEGTHVRDAYALYEGAGASPGGLTDQQVADRARLSAFLDELTSGLLEAQSAAEQYEPEVLAAVVRPWIDPQDGLDHPEMPWTGPALPGEPLGRLPEQTCITVSGDQLAAVLDAAGRANAATPWTSGDGNRWSLAFRPLLPHETGCDALLQE